MRLPRVRFTVRRLMAAMAAVAGYLAVSRLTEDGPDHSHLTRGAPVTVVAGVAAHVPGIAFPRGEIEIHGGTRAVVIADDEDDSDDASPEGRAVRFILVRPIDGPGKGKVVVVPRKYLRGF